MSKTQSGGNPPPPPPPPPPPTGRGRSVKDDQNPIIVKSTNGGSKSKE